MILKKRAVRQLGAAVAVCALAAACTQPPPQDPTPSPTPSPSPASVSPSETQLERQTRLDFEAAEKAYRAFVSEYDRAAAAGGLEKPTKVMSDNAAGPYLDVMVDFLQQQKASGARQVGRLRIAYVNEGPYSPHQLNLEVCEDGRKVENRYKDGKISFGNVAKLDLYVRPVNGRWKIWDGDDQKVNSCEK